ncbi:DUF1622 domain-containing protein [Leptolyngbya sp. KIOST-1]|uniref:DUF1622 domain-containing protein n=1 Tax=Leptolyngbya sp. KIOST-1 TaxID=1229172 RepID=UPI00055E28C9|nr:DUF1622 domain-containing protein [Leptolyngbya sp. KIOST-1]
MAWLEPLETLLENIALGVRFCLEAISVLCVVVGLLKTGRLALHLRRQRPGQPLPFNQVRLKFGTWLTLALEFQLGADILSTTIAPTTEDLIRLAVIALIRTFLNYFLDKEIEAEQRTGREQHQYDPDSRR